MDSKVAQFQKTVRDYYSKHPRDLPWRRPDNNDYFDPYKIMVSEIMLQQTQVNRVIEKYQEFLSKFPRIDTLANASFAKVLTEWNGLGYNRRAKYLHEAAKKLRDLGYFPDKVEALMALPGIGKNTAAAICVYAFNQPHVFIETNIRTVYIHHFFNNRFNVSDTEIRALVVASLESDSPREWYWALMDYGSHLKKTTGNASRQSKHYTKQSKFEGSMRQVRSHVLKQLIDGPKSQIQLTTAINDNRLSSVIRSLTQEGMIIKKDEVYLLA